MGAQLARKQPGAKETQFCDQFEWLELLTARHHLRKPAALCGGGLQPAVRKVDRFSIRRAGRRSLREREGYAARCRRSTPRSKKIIRRAAGARFQVAVPA